MIRSVLRPSAALLLPLGLFLSCATLQDQHAAEASAPSPHLYVWAGDADEKDGGFLVTLDARPDAPAYGAILSTMAVGLPSVMAHHTEFALPERWPLFANAFHSGRTFLFDLSTPGAARISGEVDSVPGYRHPHSFARLASGNVLATMQYGDSTMEGDPGGLAEFDSAGRLLRTASSADPRFAGARIRTYSLVAVPAVDRVVTTSTPMDTERTADVIQVWRLSDLSLLRTVALPAVPADSIEYYPFEARVLADGRTVLLNTYYCGIYRIADLDQPEPTVELVHRIQSAGIGCSVPVVKGRFWIVPVAYGHEIVVLDVADPARPVEVFRLPTEPSYFPHWLAADPRSDRLVVTDQGDGEPRILMLHVDSETGRLSWDERFREAGADRPGVSFDRVVWPHGPSGKAYAHGALFGP